MYHATVFSFFAFVECSDNCTLLTNSYGYICYCDLNGTNVTMPTRAPYPQCMGGCTRQSTSSSVFCNCLVSGSIGSTSTTSRCLPPCSQSSNNTGKAINLVICFLQLPGVRLFLLFFHNQPNATPLLTIIQ